MKKIILLPLALALAALACQRAAPTVVPPEQAMTDANLGAPTAIIIVPSDTPVQGEPTLGTATEGTPSATDTPLATATLIPSATSTAGPTQEGTTATATITATFPSGPFDPEDQYGDPQFVDEFNNNANWVDSSGKLPDDGLIRLTIDNGEMDVMGKTLLFDTWYFTWPTLNDFYLEMTVQTNNCTGKDSYGLIFRGSAKGEPSRGYVVAFSCDGNFRVTRIDGTNPYRTEELVLWTQDGDIINGANKTNVLGIRAQGDTIVIYANGYQLAVIQDDTYSSGRFGVFVNAGATQNFTYSALRIRFWRLD